MVLSYYIYRAYGKKVFKMKIERCTRLNYLVQHCRAINVVRNYIEQCQRCKRYHCTIQNKFAVNRISFLAKLKHRLNKQQTN